MIFPTGNNSIDSLVYSSWASSPGTAVSLTYSFMTRVPSDASIEDASGFAPMSAAQMAGVRAELATWAAVANITFTEVASGGNIQLGTNNQAGQSSGYAYLPDGHSATYLYLNNQDSYNSVFTVGSYGASVLIHELGHTLGLKHPGDYNSSGGDVDGPFLPKATDNLDYTQMSYLPSAGHGLNANYGITPMLYDIQAIQYLYGANMSYHAGADTYSFANKAAPQAIWDAGGIDTFDFSATTGANIINLNAGTFSETAPGYKNISIAYNVTIEKAIAGSGGSTIYANDAGNTITGGAGADVIYVGAGNDSIDGGAGADTVVFKQTYASYLLSGNASALTVGGEGTDTLTGIETLRFADHTIQIGGLSGIVAGTAANDRIVAGGGVELINAGAGTDTVLYAGARANYTVTVSGDILTVADQAAGGATDVLTSVERLSFANNAMVALDVGDHQIGGEAYRLYAAALNRTPDSAGLGYWINVLEQGHSLSTIAQGFLDSAEFSNAYGSNLNNLQLVTQLYVNILHRAPEAAGMAYWVGALDNGVGRADVLAYISESAENQAGVLAQIGNGFDYTLWTA